MIGQGVKATLEVGERAARAWLAVHRDRAGGALPGLEHGREGDVITFLAAPALGSEPRSTEEEEEEQEEENL
jgi:hypothetical protein